MSYFRPDVIFSEICLTILEVAVTGKLRSAGRGGGRHVMATVSSPWARIALAIVDWCLLAGILIDVSRKLLAA
jgi:hypothetical protein